MSSRFVRRVRTASGAVAVQLVFKDHGEVVEIEHVGSAHTDAELALLLGAARERVQPGQQALDLGELAAEPARVGDTADWTRPDPDRPPAADPVPTAAPGRPRSDRAGGRVVGTAALTLWNVLGGAHHRLGFDTLADCRFRRNGAPRPEVLEQSVREFWSGAAGVGRSVSDGSAAGSPPSGCVVDESARTARA